MAWFIKQTLGATLCYMWLLVANLPKYELRPNGNKNEMVMVSSSALPITSTHTLPITSTDKSSINPGTNSNAIKEHSLTLAPHTSPIHNDPNYNDPNKRTSSGARVPSPSVKPRNPADQPFALPATVESGAAFSLYYGTDFKVIRNVASDYTYLLLHGSEDDYRGKDPEMNVTAFQDPLTNYTIATSSLVGFLELLGCLGKLKLIQGSYGGRISVASACIISSAVVDLSESTIAQFHNITKSNQIIQSDDKKHNDDDDDDLNRFDAIFGSIDSPTYSSDLNRSNFISFDALDDRGPLQRAEWIKFVAAFFDLEAPANAIYSQIESNYKCLSSRIMSLHESTNKPSQKPMVGWLSYNGDLGVWTFSDTPYKLQFILDAGGVNVDQSILLTTFNMSNPKDISSFYNIAMELDVVIDETHAADPSKYMLENFMSSTNFINTSGIPFIFNKRCWRYDKRVGSNNALDWFEGAIAQPQVVLRDLIEVLYPMTIEDGYDTTYFRNVAMDESVVNTTSLRCLHDITTLSKPTILPCTISSKKT